MSKYTTGEIAKLCGVSVRTVQYYDNRGILKPSELSEGSRRLYSDDDLKRLKIICFLRDVDISINSIGELLSGDDPESIISVLLEQQEQLLREEVNERQAKLDMGYVLLLPMATTLISGITALSITYSFRQLYGGCSVYG